MAGADRQVARGVMQVAQRRGLAVYMAVQAAGIVVTIFRMERAAQSASCGPALLVSFHPLA